MSLRASTFGLGDDPSQPLAALLNDIVRNHQRGQNESKRQKASAEVSDDAIMELINRRLAMSCGGDLSGSEEEDDEEALALADTAGITTAEGCSADDGPNVAASPSADCPPPPIEPLSRAARRCINAPWGMGGGVGAGGRGGVRSQQMLTPLDVAARELSPAIVLHLLCRGADPRGGASPRSRRKMGGRYDGIEPFSAFITQNLMISSRSDKEGEGGYNLPLIFAVIDAFSAAYRRVMWAERRVASADGGAAEEVAAFMTAHGDAYRSPLSALLDANTGNALHGVVRRLSALSRPLPPFVVHAVAVHLMRSAGVRPIRDAYDDCPLYEYFMLCEFVDPEEDDEAGDGSRGDSDDDSDWVGSSSLGPPAFLQRLPLGEQRSVLFACALVAFGAIITGDVLSILDGSDVLKGIFKGLLGSVVAGPAGKKPSPLSLTPDDPTGLANCVIDALLAGASVYHWEPLVSLCLDHGADVEVCYRRAGGDSSSDAVGGVCRFLLVEGAGHLTAL